MNETVIIAAGGTGGHIYPAIAIADALKAKQPNLDIHFVGTSYGVENEIIPKAGYPVLHLPIGRLHKSVGLKERLTTLILLPFAILKAIYFCLKLRPKFLLGVGGHGSGPMLLGGVLVFFRTVVWEPNAMPGMANRILSRFVSEAIVVFEKAKQLMPAKKMVVAGFPVRSAIESLGYLGTSTEQKKLNVLVYMGSQGAGSMNKILPEALSQFPELAEQCNFVHQTGKGQIEQTLLNYQECSVEGQADVMPYIDNMEEKYKWADLVVCRSGTGTLSELAATGKPAVLIPLPFAADDHQRVNAEVFVGAGAATLINQKQGEFTAERLKDEILKLKNDPQLRSEMAKKAYALHIANSAETIAGHLLGESLGN